VQEPGAIPDYQAVDRRESVGMLGPQYHGSVRQALHGVPYPRFTRFILTPIQIQSESLLWTREGHG
jgi:hypothetical protein